MTNVSQNTNIISTPSPLQLKDIPIVYAWFGETVPQDYLISLSELDYPVQFLKNPKIERNFSRELMDIEKSDYYRLWHLYQHGGIYSDFDNTINYNCLIDLLKQYKHQDKLVFMSDGRHTRQLTQQITTNLIYAPYPKMPILKKMLDYIDQTKEKVWQFAGIKFVGQFQQPIQANMSKCVYHSYDWSWYTASNEVLGANADPHPHYAKKLVKKVEINKENQRITEQLSQKNIELARLQSQLRRISNDNIELKNQILQVHDKIIAICPKASKILNQYEDSLSSPTTMFFSTQSEENEMQQNGQLPSGFTEKNEIKLCGKINSLRDENNQLKKQNDMLGWEVYGMIILVIVLMVMGLVLKLRSRKKHDEFKQLSLQDKTSFTQQ